MPGVGVWEAGAGSGVTGPWATSYVMTCADAAVETSFLLQEELLNKDLIGRLDQRLWARPLSRNGTLH